MKIRIMSDPNMETLRAWASEFPVLDALPTNLQNNIEKLIGIIANPVTDITNTKRIDPVISYDRIIEWSNSR
jgi:hypothetical protein